MKRMSEAGKGSDRRKENAKRTIKNLNDMKYGVRDKTKDTFKVTVNGKR